MPGPEDYRCCVEGCNATNAAWGFHKRYYCDQHRALIDVAMQITQADGVDGQLPRSEQPDGRPVQGVLI